MEIINCLAGVNLFDETRPSRLCKLNLLDMFKLLMTTAMIKTPTLNQLQAKFKFVMPKEIENNSETGGKKEHIDNLDADTLQNKSKISFEEEFVMQRPCPGVSSYHALKQFSVEYFEVKKAFFKTLYYTGLGTWIGNCVDCDMFDLNE